MRNKSKEGIESQIKRRWGFCNEKYSERYSSGDRTYLGIILGRTGIMGTET